MLFCSRALLSLGCFLMTDSGMTLGITRERKRIRKFYQHRRNGLPLASSSAWDSLWEGGKLATKEARHLASKAAPCKPVFSFFFLNHKHWTNEVTNWDKVLLVIIGTNLFTTAMLNFKDLSISFLDLQECQTMNSISKQNFQLFVICSEFIV